MWNRKEYHGITVHINTVKSDDLGMNLKIEKRHSDKSWRMRSIQILSTGGIDMNLYSATWKKKKISARSESEARRIATERAVDKLDEMIEQFKELQEGL